MKIKFLVLLALIIGFSTSIHAGNHSGKKGLPPGLKMNAERGKPLPPGWEMKLKKGAILEPEIYQHSKVVVPVDSKGLLTVSIEGKLVRLYDATREVVEVLK